MIKFERVVKKLSKSFALNEVSFRINEFDACALVGNNGSGKTTIIRILCGLLPYDSGNVFFQDKKVSPACAAYKNELGVVLSKPYFIEDFSCYEYLSFVAKFQKIDKSLVKDRINDLVQLLSIESLTQKIKTFSSGAQMKVSLAAALIHNPKVLILDEPFVNLDVATVQTAISLIKDLRTKKTLLLTSHSLGIIAELCDKVLILEKGKILTQLENPDFNSPEKFREDVKQYLIKSNYSFEKPDWLN